MSLDRRSFLKTLAAAPAASLAAPRDSRPNIIVIMADDMGFSDIGCFGSEIATPNLDRLAKGGVRFTHFYNSARCCPTRAALLTGLYPHEAGIGDMINPRDVPSYQGYLNDNCVTFAEALRPAGYNAFMCGKWHVGEDRPHWPTDRGFQNYFGLISGASNYWRLEPPRQMALDDKPYTPAPGKFYMTDAFTDYAVKWIDQYGSKPEPYFLYLAYTAPHWPLHAWPEDIAKYRGKYRKGWDALRRERHQRQLAMGIVNKKWPLTKRDETVAAWDDVKDKDAQDLRMAVYAAQIDRLDQNIGRVLDKVKQLGQEDNTLIMFLADNGGCHEENIRGEKKDVPPGPVDSFTSYGRPWANASNTPFRMYKHWVHEGGISSPFIARWPARIRQKGALIHQPAHITDILPTCLDVARGTYPKERNGKPITPGAGTSLLPAFSGARWAGRETIYWEHEGNRAMREGKWKIVSQFPGEWELFDLEADRTETRDLAASDPARLKRMIAMYDAWAARCGVVPWDQLRKRG
jgi:arylsulfatase A-like enzyme